MPMPSNRTMPVMTGSTSEYVPGQTQTVTYPSNGYQFPAPPSVPRVPASLANSAYPNGMRNPQATAAAVSPQMAPPTFQQFVSRNAGYGGGFPADPVYRQLIENVATAPVYRDLYSYTKSSGQ